MIRYALHCHSGHAFESWFQSATAFDGLAAAGHVTCPVCNSAEVGKSLMAPAVTPARKAAPAPKQPQPSDTPAAAAAPTAPSPKGLLSTPANPMEQALAQLRREVEANSEYVGSDFAREARRIHDGATPERAIHGEARLEEARKLIEDGVSIAPLPFRTARKTN
ncbi:MAG: DUF1178 family protein [Paracoccaceae bacterium]|nr:DUF1178 family protein [Paracoccaceae bacterium]